MVFITLFMEKIVGLGWSSVGRMLVWYMCEALGSVPQLHKIGHGGI